MIKNFFNISDLSQNDLLRIIQGENISSTIKGKNIGLILEKYSALFFLLLAFHNYKEMLLI